MPVTPKPPRRSRYPIKAAAFDLSGDLTAVPKNYLFVVLKRQSGKADVLRWVADELKRRGFNTANITRDGSTACNYCPKPALYRVGKLAACGDHKEEVTTRRALASTKMNNQTAERHKEINDTQRLCERSEQHHARMGVRRTSPGQRDR